MALSRSVIALALLCPLIRFSGALIVQNRSYSAHTTDSQATAKQVYSSTLRELNNVVIDSLRHDVKNFDKTIDELNVVVGQNLEGNTDNPDALAQQQQYIKWARGLASNASVCETGFNAGHSALAYLAYSQAKVYEFDIGFHDYGKKADAFLQSKFPGRLLVTWGDSTQTLAVFPKQNPSIKCDLIIVDGGHSDDVARADLVNFAHMATSHHRLVIDDTPCSASYCQGPTNQWTALEQQGCIKSERKVAMNANRGFSYGRYTPCALWPESVNDVLKA